MMDAATWERANAAFLTTSLSWLRVKLEAVNAKDPEPVAARPRAAPKRPALVTGTTDHVPLPAMDPPPALAALAQRFALSNFEQDVLLLCVAMEIDTGIAALCARAQDDPQRRYPTFALALAAFDDASWDVLSPERPLRYWRMVEAIQHEAAPLTTSPLRADERIVHYVKGMNYLDERLNELVVQIDHIPRDGDLPASQQLVAEAIFRRWKREPDGPLPLAQLVGPDAASSRRIALEVTTALGRRLYRLPIEALPRGGAEAGSLARLWRREAALMPIALYVDASDADHAAESALLPALRRFLARGSGYAFVATRELWPSLDADGNVFDIAKPTTDEQQRLWGTALATNDPNIPELLAAQFDLDASTIVRVAAGERDERAGGSLLVRTWDRCRAELRPQLDTLAHRLDAKATWDDLVLPAAQLEQLHQIADQVAARYTVYETWGFGAKMNRGFGISALFAGESGVGKTMSAEVIANALRLSLYRIDLSSVVSKYIGETEKNLRKLFDAADDGGAILFFDEADALFGKRSEVRDSHDRYANIEINYLLQRVENFRGLAILATNAKSALDSAFVRRLRFIVTFPHPGVAERKRMWQHAFPPQTVVESLDVARLARLNLTGAAIHNAALNAAFLAARAATSVTMPLILAASRAEFAKSDRPINEVDFRAEPAGSTTP